MRRNTYFVKGRSASSTKGVSRISADKGGPRGAVGNFKVTDLDIKPWLLSVGVGYRF